MYKNTLHSVKIQLSTDCIFGPSAVWVVEYVLVQRDHDCIDFNWTFRLENHHSDLYSDQATTLALQQPTQWPCMDWLRYPTEV